MQSTVLLVTFALVAVLAAAFWWAISGKDDAGIAAQRSKFIWALVIAGAVITFMSLREWPHNTEAAPPSVTVKVTGHQWYWEIDKKTLPAGVPVVFAVSSADVNHGFGIYDKRGVILFQTQAMPGYVNKVRHTFKYPGTYKVFCMEYCGGGHHVMPDEIKIVAK
jgi:cytochrome c oxidase subunit 2